MAKTLVVPRLLDWKCRKLQTGSDQAPETLDVRGQRTSMCHWQQEDRRCRCSSLASQIVPTGQYGVCNTGYDTPGVR